MGVKVSLRSIFRSLRLARMYCRSFSLAPFLADYRSLSLSLRGLPRPHS